jgi:hypothetical protein
MIYQPPRPSAKFLVIQAIRERKISGAANQMTAQRRPADFYIV